MSDQLPATAVAVQEQPRAVRQFERVSDVLPAFDTARFEHMNRIAQVMAASSLTPESIRCEKKGRGEAAEWVPLPPSVVIANCFLIVNQAYGWNADPFAVAQCCSVVHGKLMFEGKLVAAVLEARLGVALSYEFGRWDAKTLRVIVGEDAAGDMLGVIVSGLREGDTAPQTVEGCVAEWRTSGNNSPWGKPANWKRQLRYRGAREWARAFAPATMIGIITDDEMDVLAERREEISAIPTRPALSGGFTDDPPKPPRSPRKAATPEPAIDAAPPVDASDAPRDAEFEPVSQEVEAATGPQATDGVQNAEPEPVSQDCAIGVSGVSAAATSSPEALAVERNSGSGGTGPDDGDEEQTTAAPGETYLLFGDTYVDGRRTTYKDGKPFSTVTEKGAGKLPTHDFHAPELEVADESDAGEKSPTTSDASPAPVDDDDFPGDRPASPPAEGGPFAECKEAMAAATDWPAIKAALSTLAGTVPWTQCEAEGKRMIRLAAWERFTELRDAGDVRDIMSDFSLFRFWVEFGAEDAAAVDANWRRFFRTSTYTDASEAGKNGLATLMAERKAELAGKK